MDSGMATTTATTTRGSGHDALGGSGSLSITTSVTSVRRKPQFTYQSPSNTDFRLQIPLISSKNLSKAYAPSSSSAKVTTAPKPSTSISTITPREVMDTVAKRKKYPMGPPLPLYHPLGRLAVSLPPLDPSTLGLPNPMRIHESGRRSSARARRPAAKLRDAEEEGVVPVTSAGTIVATVSSAGAGDMKEKVSPRKRRTGGGGVGSKRKRREADDGDATYPAKRTRQPRGGGGVGVGVGSGVGEDGSSPTESAAAAAEQEVTPAPESASEVLEERRRERRSARTRGVKRRDSSGSETGSVSVSAGVGGLTGTTKQGKGEKMDSDGNDKIEDGKKEDEGPRLALQP